MKILKFLLIILLISPFNNLKADNEVLKNKITNFSFVWNNIFYQSSKVNLFDIFFFKTKTYEEYDKTITAISIGATYYQPINPHEKFLNSYEVLKYFNYLFTQANDYINKKS